MQLDWKPFRVAFLQNILFGIIAVVMLLLSKQYVPFLPWGVIVLLVAFGLALIAVLQESWVRGLLHDAAMGVFVGLAFVESTSAITIALTVALATFLLVPAIVIAAVWRRQSLPFWVGYVARALAIVIAFALIWFK